MGRGREVWRLSPGCVVVAVAAASASALRQPVGGGRIGLNIFSFEPRSTRAGGSRVHDLSRCGRSRLTFWMMGHCASLRAPRSVILVDAHRRNAADLDFLATGLDFRFWLASAVPLVGRLRSCWDLPELTKLFDREAKELGTSSWNFFCSRRRSRPHP